MEKREEPLMYRIRVLGILDPNWSEWLESMSIVSEDQPNGCNTTILTGRVADQAALRGILTRLWDLNLDVLSVTRIDRKEGKPWRGG
jgi:hypothetical protein